MFEDTIRDLLVTGLADGELFGVCLEPEGLHPDVSLLRIPNNVFESEPDNTGDAIHALRRGVTGCVDQMALAELLQYCSMDNYTVLAALSEYYHDA